MAMKFRDMPDAEVGAFDMRSDGDAAETWASGRNPFEPGSHVFRIDRVAEKPGEKLQYIFGCTCLGGPGEETGDVEKIFLKTITLDNIESRNFARGWLSAFMAEDDWMNEDGTIKLKAYPGIVFRGDIMIRSSEYRGRETELTDIDVNTIEVVERPEAKASSKSAAYRPPKRK